MRIFFDTEFYENGRTIELISIGLVREDGEEWYVETPRAMELATADPWLKENVLPHLRGRSAVAARATIARDILSFSGLPRGEKPEFWAYYADYDWVVLCQLYGRMIDLPKGYPMFCRDIKQWCVELGNPKLPDQPEGEHDALADARWNKSAWEFLRDFKG